jgi:hypothetical protein
LVVALFCRKKQPRVPPASIRGVIWLAILVVVLLAPPTAFRGPVLLRAIAIEGAALS